MYTTQVAYLNWYENRRHNVATETETHRSNVASESLGRDTLNETIRKNTVQEEFNHRTLEETKRSNMARESETSRHNLATENVAYAQLNETIRHDKAQEYVAAGNLQEMIRSNQANERIKHRSLVETIRSNTASEAIKQEANRVAAENAATNKLNATINFTNAETRRAELEQQKVRDENERANQSWRNSIETLKLPALYVQSYGKLIDAVTPF